MSPGTAASPLSGPVGVTGALGFVASHLIPRLLAERIPVVAIVRPGRDATALERAGCRIRHADLLEPEAHAEAFAGLGAVVHLAGMSQATRLVPVLESAQVPRAVLIGSAGVYTRLESASADAKRLGEAVLRRSRLGYVILRPSMIYGTLADRNLARLLRMILAYGVVPVPGGGGTLQQPVHVDDLVQAIVAGLRLGPLRREYDVGGPEPMTLREMVRICARALGRRALVVPVPLAPAYLLARGARAVGLPFPVRPEQIQRLGESKAVNIEAAKVDLSFGPRAFEDGIRAEAQELLRSRAGGPGAEPARVS